jgi:hypothetical protein
MRWLLADWFDFEAEWANFRDCVECEADWSLLHINSDTVRDASSVHAIHAFSLFYLNRSHPHSELSQSTRVLTLTLTLTLSSLTVTLTLSRCHSQLGHTHTHTLILSSLTLSLSALSSIMCTVQELI